VPSSHIMHCSRPWATPMEVLATSLCTTIRFEKTWQRICIGHAARELNVARTSPPDINRVRSFCRMQFAAPAVMPVPQRHTLLQVAANQLTLALAQG